MLIRPAETSDSFLSILRVQSIMKIGIVNVYMERQCKEAKSYILYYVVKCIKLIE